MTVNQPVGDRREDEKYMRCALAQARQAKECDEVPVGAVIVHAGRVIAQAHNQTIALHDSSAHAEILALRRAGAALGNYRLCGAVLYVTLEPCAMCYAAAVHARVEGLVYAACDPKSGVLGGAADFSELPFFNHRPHIGHHVLADEASRLLQEFFVRRR